MKIQEKILIELDGLSLSEYSYVYQYIKTVKANRPLLQVKKRDHWFDEVREVLRGIGGDLCSDIIEGREERV
jgi:hypothetical protein